MRPSARIERGLAEQPGSSRPGRSARVGRQPRALRLFIAALGLVLGATTPGKAGSVFSSVSASVGNASPNVISTYGIGSMGVAGNSLVNYSTNFPFSS